MKLLLPVLSATLIVLAPTGPAAAKAVGSSQHATIDACSWNRPGANPYTGDVVAAVDRYTDIPTEVRARLKARMAQRDYDDLVTIRRDDIKGRHGQQYGPGIRDMHFGNGTVCRTVTRQAWKPKTVERGLVYCDSGQCILVPTVCRNVSRITRRGVSDGGVGGLPPAGGSSSIATAAPDADPPPGSFAAGTMAGPLSVAGGGEPLDGLPPIEYFGPTGAGAPAPGAGSSSIAIAADGGSLVGPASPGPFVGAVPPVVFGPGAAGGGPVIASDPGGPGDSGDPGSPGGGDPAPPFPGGGGGGVTPVPEPQTVWMMLGGLALLVGVARRAARPAHSASNGLR